MKAQVWDADSPRVLARTYLMAVRVTVTRRSPWRHSVTKLMLEVLEVERILTEWSMEASQCACNLQGTSTQPLNVLTVAPRSTTSVRMICVLFCVLNIKNIPYHRAPRQNLRTLRPSIPTTIGPVGTNPTVWCRTLFLTYNRSVHTTS